MYVKQISVFLENKPGMLEAMTGILAEDHIDMRALSMAETNDFGIVRIIVNDVYAASTLLKAEGFVNNVTPVLGVAIPDEPGGLNKVVAILSQEGINIEYMYAFLGGKDADHAYMIFRVQDVKAAAIALQSKGVRCITQDEISML